MDSRPKELPASVSGYTIVQSHSQTNHHNRSLFHFSKWFIFDLHFWSFPQRINSTGPGVSQSPSCSNSFPDSSSSHCPLSCSKEGRRARTERQQDKQSTWKEVAPVGVAVWDPAPPIAGAAHCPLQADLALPLPLPHWKPWNSTFLFSLFCIITTYSILWENSSFPKITHAGERNEGRQEYMNRCHLLTKKC